MKKTFQNDISRRLLLHLIIVVCKIALIIADSHVFDGHVDNAYLM